MNRMRGYLKGKPQVLSNLDYNILKERSGYSVKTRIIDVKKPRQFSLLSKSSENGVRLFCDDLIGHEIYIDKIALEDAITFQEIEFGIIDFPKSGVIKT